MSEFKSITDRLVVEIQSAYMHFELYKELTAELQKHRESMNKSKHFWSLTFNAHLESTRTALIRVYDQNPKNLGLVSWLNEYRKTEEKPEHYEEEQKNRVHKDPLREGEWEADMRSVLLSDPLVSVLIKRHRHTEIAHVSLKNAKTGASAFKTFPLTVAELQELIDRAATILNKYSVHTDGSVHGLTTMDSKDYVHLFE